MYVSQKYFPSLRPGHSRIYRHGDGVGRARCVRCGEFDPKTCAQDSGKVRDRYVENHGKPEHFSPLKKARDEGFVGGEARMTHGSAVILPFAYGERVRIEIPALNLKFGAKKEYPLGATGSLVGRDSYGRNFLVKLEKAWKKNKEETIKEIWTPAALLAQASIAVS